MKLPQEVAGALFSRYSRSAKSLRRVFLDEFQGEAGILAGAPAGGDDDALTKARAFYDRVLVGYGDDSVAQLGGAHVAVERVSNVAAQVLEDARIGIAFLEKSTRYVRFDKRDAAGDFLWFREPALMASRHRDAYVALMDGLFAAYAAQIDPMIAHIERVLLQAIAKATEGDAEELRGLRTHTARPLERLYDEAALDLADHVVEVAAVFG